jgi:hypothetical protein
MRPVEEPLTALDLMRLATGSLQCDRARWSERETPDCSSSTPCPRHAEIYRALHQAAQDRGILEGLAAPDAPKRASWIKAGRYNKGRVRHGE